MNQKSLSSLHVFLGIFVILGLAAGGYYFHVNLRKPVPLVEPLPTSEINPVSESLSVSGVIERYGQTGYLSPVFRVPQPPSEGEGSGDYSVELLDPNNQVLKTYYFNPIPVIAEGEPMKSETSGFSFRLPVIQGVRKILLKRGPQVLHTLAPGQNIPEVRVLSSNAQPGKAISQTLEVVWEAKDKDGDNLSYEVWYSQDGGQQWTLAARIPHTTLSWDVSRLEKTDLGVIRILATDGINTGVRTLGSLTIDPSTR